MFSVSKTKYRHIYALGRCFQLLNPVGDFHYPDSLSAQSRSIFVIPPHFLPLPIVPNATGYVRQNILPWFTWPNTDTDTADIFCTITTTLLWWRRWENESQCVAQLFSSPCTRWPTAQQVGSRHADVGKTPTCAALDSVLHKLSTRATYREQIWRRSACAVETRTFPRVTIGNLVQRVHENASGNEPASSRSMRATCHAYITFIFTPLTLKHQTSYLTRIYGAFTIHYLPTSIW